MADTLPTVSIVDPDHPDQMLVINAGDFNPAVHTRWEDRDMDRGTTATPPAIPVEAPVPHNAPVDIPPEG